MNKETTLTLNLIGNNACKINDVTSDQRIYLFNDLPEIAQYADEHHGKMPKRIEVYLDNVFAGALDPVNTITPISRMPGYDLGMVFPPFAETNTLQIRKYNTVTE